ncbi:ARM repeat-containing protein [Atractiella rhizophila]|nr:ARM repeat-containing protein [Atractiella rhizophila]
MADLNHSSTGPNTMFLDNSPQSSVSPSTTNYDSPLTSPDNSQGNISKFPSGLVGGSAFTSPVTQTNLTGVFDNSSFPQFVPSYGDVKTTSHGDALPTSLGGDGRKDSTIQMLQAKIDQLRLENSQKDIEITRLRTVNATNTFGTSTNAGRSARGSRDDGFIGSNTKGSTFNPAPGAPSPTAASFNLYSNSLPSSARPSPRISPMGLGLMGLGTMNANSNPWTAGTPVSFEGDEYFGRRAGDGSNTPPARYISGSGYNTPLLGGENINYRQLLENDADADYNMLCREVVTKNNQQASIFMQQKIKIAGSDERKKLILDAVLTHALSLMTNKFGNFLVSRSLEHGGESWRCEVSKLVKGNVYKVACDNYGVHVVQKMCDYEDYIRDMIVSEYAPLIIMPDVKLILSKIGHVWTKILSYPLKKDLHEQLLNTLRGSWSKIAQDETGSLLVQSCLENWIDRDKTEIVQELLAEVVPCALTGWGNFVVLNLIEHGDERDRPVIFDRLLKSSVELSLSHTGAKTIEKMIKVAGLESDVVTKYVDQIVQQGPETRRPPCVEIACHGPGSQILTLLFTGATQENKDRLIGCIRRHGVTMKSSKHGSRIFYLVERTRAWTVIIAQSASNKHQIFVLLLA